MQRSSSRTPSANDIISRTGPFHFTRTFMSLLLCDDEEKRDHAMIALPTSFFYPLPNSMRTLTRSSDKRVYYKNHSFAVHHWSCSWQSSLQKKKDGDDDVKEAAAPISSSVDTKKRMLNEFVAAHTQTQHTSSLLASSELQNRIMKFL